MSVMSFYSSLPAFIIGSLFKRLMDVRAAQGLQAVGGGTGVQFMIHELLPPDYARWTAVRSSVRLLVLHLCPSLLHSNAISMAHSTSLLCFLELRSL